MAKKNSPHFPGSMPIFHELVELRPERGVFMAVAKSDEYHLKWAMTEDYVRSVRNKLLTTYADRPKLCPIADKVVLTLSESSVFYRTMAGGDLLTLGRVSLDAARDAACDLAVLLGQAAVLPFRKKG